MFDPDITLPALREMHRRFGERIYGRYGFTDAFHPTDGWVNPDVIGIDLGITLLSAENLRTGRVWTWFMQNPEIGDARSTGRGSQEMTARDRRTPDRRSRHGARHPGHRWHFWTRPSDDRNTAGDPGTHGILDELRIQSTCSPPGTLDRRRRLAAAPGLRG